MKTLEYMKGAVCFFVCIAIMFGHINLLRAQQTFVKSYGGTGMEKLMHPIFQTPDSGFCMGGPTISFGAGAEDVLLIKTNANGTLQWARTYGGTGTDYRHSAAKTFDGGYIMSGWTNSFGGGMEAFLLKVTANGTYQWMKTYGWVGSNEFSFSVVQSPDNGYAFLGQTSTGSGDILFVKTDISGSVQWARTYGNNTAADQGMRLISTADSGYLLVSRAASFSAGAKDFLLMKTDPSGIVQWSRTFGGSGDENVYDIIQTSDGGYATCGRTLSFGAGSTDGLIVKMDANGSLQWARTYGGTLFDDFANSIIQTSDGGYVTSGHIQSFGAGSDDCSIMKIDPAGNLQWAKVFGGALQDENVAIIQTMDGGYALNGFVTSYGAGNNDGLLMKTTATGEITGCFNTVNPTVGIPSLVISSPSIVGINVTPVVGTPVPTLSSPVLTTTEICQLTFQITTSSNPSNGGTTSGGGMYPSGQSATVIATPYSGWDFVNWTENGISVSMSPSYSFTVTANRSLVANFSPSVTYLIQTSSNPSNGGTTSGGGYYTNGSNATVIATADTNWQFVNWTENGNVVSITSVYTFIVTANRFLIANFQYTNVPEPFNLIFPPDDTTGLQLSFNFLWENSVGAANYHILLADDENFVNLIVDSLGLTLPQFYIQPGVLYPNTAYYWKVRAYNNTGSTFSTAYSFITGYPTGLSALPDNTIKVFPNPSEDYFVITCSVSEKRHLTIELYDSFGKLSRLICDREIENVFYKTKVETSELGTGVFFLKVTNQLTTKIFKIIILKSKNLQQG